MKLKDREPDRKFYTRCRLCNRVLLHAKSRVVGFGKFCAKKMKVRIAYESDEIAGQLRLFKKERIWTNKSK